MAYSCAVVCFSTFICVLFRGAVEALFPALVMGTYFLEMQRMNGKPVALVTPEVRDVAWRGVFDGVVGGVVGGVVDGVVDGVAWSVAAGGARVLPRVRSNAWAGTGSAAA